MQVTKVLFASVLSAFLLGCGDDEPAQEAQQSSSTTETASATASSGTSTTASQPAQQQKTDKIDEAIFALKFFSAGERDKAAAEAARIFGEIKKKQTEIEGKAEAAALTELKELESQAMAELDKLKADKDTVWWKVANAYAKALYDYKRAFDKVAMASK